MQSITQIIPDLIRRNDGRPVTAEIHAEAYRPPDYSFRVKITAKQPGGGWAYYEAETLEMAYTQACCGLHHSTLSEQSAEFDRVASELPGAERKEVAA